MNCNAAPMWRFLCAMQLKNVQVLEAEKRRTNDERRTTNERMIGSNFRDWSEFLSTGTNSDRLVRIPNDWSKFRTIGPNDWSEFRTNSEQMTSLTSVSSKTKKNCWICWIALLLRCGDSCVQSNLKMFKCWWPKKKSAWTDLDRVSFKKICQTVNGSKLKNRRGLV